MSHPGTSSSTYHLAPFVAIPLDEKLLALLIAEHESLVIPRLSRLWSYYRNALAEPSAAGGSLGPPAQAAGLPDRLREEEAEPRAGIAGEDADRFARELVIENDIAWRIHTLVDFMFPESPRIVSKADNSRTAQEVEMLLSAIIDANGGNALWQDAALLGSVYGHVDFHLNCDALVTAGARSTGHERMSTHRRQGDATDETQAGANTRNALMSHSLRAILPIAQRILIETIEAPRAIPLLAAGDYRQLDAYIIHFRQFINEVEQGGWFERLWRNLTTRHATASTAGRRASVTVTQIVSPTHCQRYIDGELVEETINRLGRIPVVHVQNLSQPLAYHGLSDVEPLIPLQDELNTRLSDRANRVTMQSFRMWLAKGIENFEENPVGPGQMWSTENTDASIEAFGGDADSPSEKQHIEELREALDKASGVTPAAAGHIKARVGNLTSENALRISLMGTIAKTKRKRITYGRGIANLCELILHALDVYGVYATEPHERAVEVVWADPIASDESRKIADALAKAQLGIPTEILRAELGYPDARDTGLV